MDKETAEKLAKILMEMSSKKEEKEEKEVTLADLLEKTEVLKFKLAEVLDGGHYGKLLFNAFVLHNLYLQIMGCIYVCEEDHTEKSRDDLRKFLDVINADIIDRIKDKKNDK